MKPDENWESYIVSNPELISYQLLIDLNISQNIEIGRLGSFNFPRGCYIYTGSARRNLVARVRRHLSKQKTIRWHIDYLLHCKDAQIVGLNFSAQPECEMNKQSPGETFMQGFGASDCKFKCGSHLKYIGESN